MPGLKNTYSSMMDLDLRSSFESIDLSQMHLRFALLGAQAQQAYAAGKLFAESLPPIDYKRIYIAAMGGSAMGAALVLSAYAAQIHVPVVLWRQYDLPPGAAGPDTLVIAVSKSGDTEETISAFEAAMKLGCKIVVMTTGGALEHRATAAHIPLFHFTFDFTPREAIGWLTFPLISLLSRLGVIANPQKDVDETIALLNSNAARFGIDSPAIRNPAKRIAGQVVHRLPIIYGSPLLAAAAQRWKSVLNENAKMMAAWDEVPELNHNSVVGYEQPEDLWRKAIVIQLRSSMDHPRVSERFDVTTRLMLEAGINQDTIRAQGRSALAQVMSTVQYGDWVSYYAAIMTGIDPSPTTALDWIKAELRG
ncbi:MAG TPA: bifunctional phosphoglucose/phosphomannose isomerase [Anaerolineae bacterium]